MSDLAYRGLIIDDDPAIVTDLADTITQWDSGASPPTAPSNAEAGRR